VGEILLTRRSNTVPLRSTGQNLSSFFVVLLRKMFPQKIYLNSAVYRNVTFTTTRALALNPKTLRS
jgi:hypothetical protein